MLITVITPLYNGLEFLEECVDSVIAQTYKEWEMIIAVNGHGEDGGAVNVRAREIAGRDVAGRVRVVVQSPTAVKGKVASLNAIVNEARGEWICLLDADDVWLPTKLEEQIAALRGPAKNCAVVGTACQYFGDMGGSPAVRAGILQFHDFLQSNHVINSSAMIHRSYCRWRDGYGMEDYDMWLRITAAGGFIYNVWNVLIKHRIHSGSAFNSAGHKPELLQADFKAVGLLAATWAMT
jgi:teichuronic acid biosynthesis glycosyltransferase TuaG